jgi:hypothetical protein
MHLEVTVVANSEAIVNSCYCTEASIRVDCRTRCSQLTMPLTETDLEDRVWSHLHEEVLK